MIDANMITSMHALRINADDSIFNFPFLPINKSHLIQIRLDQRALLSPNNVHFHDVDGGGGRRGAPRRRRRRWLAAAGTSDLCGLAETAFGECTAYVAGGEPAVSRRCCRALGDIRDLAATAAERRAVCACILSEMLAAGDGRVDSGRAAGLPAACNVRVGFIPTSPNFNCFR